MKKTYKLSVDVAVVKESKKGNTKTIPVRYHVKGMMDTIKRMMPSSELQTILDEYAKFYILDQIGVEVYPLEK